MKLLNLSGSKEIADFVQSEAELKQKLEKAVEVTLTSHRRLGFLNNFLSGPVVATLWISYQLLWWVLFYYIVLRKRLDGMPMRVFLY